MLYQISGKTKQGSHLYFIFMSVQAQHEVLRDSAMGVR